MMNPDEQPPVVPYPPNLEAIAAAALEANPVARRKRLCRFPGCKSVIKSHGHCQKHGAKSKRCKVVGCDKQAQGGAFEGMCKRHFKLHNAPPPEADPAVAAAAAQEQAAAAALEKYQDFPFIGDLLAESMQWTPPPPGKRRKMVPAPAPAPAPPPETEDGEEGTDAATAAAPAPAPASSGRSKKKRGQHPVVEFLVDNYKSQPKGWLRLSEARKFPKGRPLPSLTSQLHPDEVTMLVMVKMAIQHIPPNTILVPVEEGDTDTKKMRVDKLLCHAFGKSEAGLRGTVTRYLQGGEFVAKRKVRKNKGQTVFDSEESRKQVYTARNYFNKVRHRQEPKISEDVLKLEWTALNEEDKKYYETQAMYQLEESRKLHDRLKEAYKTKKEDFTGNGFSRDMSTIDPRTNLSIPLISSQRTHEYLSSLRESGEL